MRQRRVLLSVAVSMAVLAICEAGEGATWRVDPAGSGDFTEIQSALDAAAAGDIVLVAPGEYVIAEPLTFNRLNDPGDPSSPPLRDLVLRSETGRPETTIRMASPLDPERASVFVFEKGESRSSILAGFRLVGGTGTRYGSEDAEKGGGGVYCTRGSSPTLRDLTISRNSAPLGGGLFCEEGCSPNVTSATITGNGAEQGGGVFTFRGNLRLSNSVVARNFATYGGGIASASASPTIVHCTITGNASRFGAGGVFFDGRDAGPIESSILWGNAGGSLEATRFTPPLSVSHSCVEGPEPWPGAGNIDVDPRFCGWGDRDEVFVDASYPYRGQGTSELPYSDLIHASGFNYGLAEDSPCVGAGENGTTQGAEREPCAAAGAPVRRLRLAPGTYDVGILTFGSGRVELEGSGARQSFIRGTVAGLREGDNVSKVSVTGGSAGGMIVSAGESPAIEDCALVQNEKHGLACSERSSPRLARCVIAENRGVGIFAYPGSAPSCDDCTITANVHNGEGVGCLVVGGSARFARCLFTENLGSSALSVVDGGSIDLDSCTVAANAGHGIERSGGSVSVARSIIWGNLGEPLHGYDGATPSVVAFSCLDARGGEVLPGDGNINRDPLFCGYAGDGEVFVDAAAAWPGDGSPESPYPDFAWARQFSFALGEDSPCLHTENGNVDMGALQEICERAGVPLRLVHVAPGHYGRVPISVFAVGAALEGAGPDLTSLAGPVTGLRAGARLAGVTVSGWASSVLAAVHVFFTPGEPPSIADCRVTDNQSHGIRIERGWTERGPEILRCEVSRNIGWGVAASLATSVACSFEENYSGGVLLLDAGAPPGATKLVGCRIAGNGGWGIYSEDGSSCELERCEIVGCSEGGLLLSYAGADLRNCMIAGNGGDGIHGAFKSFLGRIVGCTIAGNAGPAVVCHWNLQSLESCILWGNGDGGPCSRGERITNLTEEDPLFVRPGAFDFARFGDIEILGATVTLPDFVVEPPDFRLRPGSPAIDAGAANPELTEDIDGNARPCGGRIDIGAHETGGCKPAGARFRRGDTNADGLTNLPDAVATLLYLFMGGDRPVCEESADIDDSGSLEITDPVLLLLYLFVGSTSPRAPFPDCGLDPTVDTTPCAAFPPCE